MTSCCTLKMSVSRETSRFFAFFDLLFCLRFSIDDAGYAGYLLGLGKHESGIRMQLSCVFASAMEHPWQKNECSMTSCCTLKMSVSRETSKFFAFFDLLFSCVFLLMMRCMRDLFSVLESTKVAYVCNFRAFSHLHWTMFRALNDMLLFVSRIRKMEDVSHET